ncbi:hypothetical protein PDESU_05240 [Pontiella desulfatans]|uniref:Uncharacterized protein n=2 Tax=Pontiella desulfatans TaxID=2750659 RepID=A0A6C2U9T7_PONDE|nr:hypothetical protein PDESU_05240 [Pontiella desulfatans]
MKLNGITSSVVLAVAVTVFCGCSENVTPKVVPSAEASTSVLFAEGIPGGVIVDTLTLDAEVVAINQKERKATLLMPGGEKLRITVGPEAVNFDQIQKGDRVKAVVQEELVVYLGDENSAADDGAAVLAMRAEKGEQPGGMVADAVRTTATVTAVDLEAHTATLTFQDGSIETVEVRPDVELTSQSVGEKVVFEITKVVALSVEKMN